jgi:hypothetical protein
MGSSIWAVVYRNVHIKGGMSFLPSGFIPPAKKGRK